LGVYNKKTCLDMAESVLFGDTRARVYDNACVVRYFGIKLSMVWR